MADITFYGHWICPFCQRVQFSLEYHRLEYQHIEVPPGKARPAGFVVPPEFVEHAHKGQVPLLRDGDRYLSDSIPILEELESKSTSSPLLPNGDAERRAVMERVHWLDENLMKPLVRSFLADDAEKAEAGRRQLVRTLGDLETLLDGREWLAGDRVSLAEVIAIPAYIRLEGLTRLGIDWGELGPQAGLHFDRCRSLRGWPAVRWSEQQYQGFVEIYGRF